MLVRVSPNLTVEERETVYSDIKSLLPSATVSGFGDPRFQVVSSREFGAHDNPEIPAVTPAALHGFLLHKVNIALLQFPGHGFLNLCLYLKRVCVSGFSKGEREDVKNMVRVMGGVCDSQLVKQTHFLVAKDAFSRRVKWAQQHRIPVIGKQWLVEMMRSQAFVGYKEFEIRKLEGVSFSAAKCTQAEEQRIREDGARAGGMCGRRLNFKDQFVVVPSDANMGASKKVRLAVMLRIPMITARDFDDFLAGRKEESFLRDEPVFTGSVFRNLVFRVDDNTYGSDDLKQWIKLNGGRLSDRGFDFRIMSWGSDSSGKARTPVWLERCIVEQEVLDPGLCPWYIPSEKQSKDPVGLVVSITGFSFRQKLDIVSALKWYRIAYSPNLIHECTTLIASNAQTPKCKTALQWNIHVFTVDWLLSFIRGEDTDPSQFLLIPPQPLVLLSKPKPTPNFLDEDDDDFIFEATALIEQQLTQRKSPRRSSRASPMRRSPPRASASHDDIPRKLSPIRSTANKPPSIHLSPHRQSPAAAPSHGRKLSPLCSPSRPIAKQPSNHPPVFLDDDDDEAYLQLEEDLERQGLLENKPPEQTTADEILSASKCIKNYRKRRHRRAHHERDIEQIEGWDTFTQRPPDDDESSSMTVGYVNDDDQCISSDPHNDPLMIQL